MLVIAVAGDLDHDEAVRLAQGVVQKNPQVAGFVDTLGWVYVKKNMTALALPMLEEAIARTQSAGSPGMGDFMGMILPLVMIMMMGTVLRYPYEVRQDAEYFTDISDIKLPEDMMGIAEVIIERKSGQPLLVLMDPLHPDPGQEIDGVADFEAIAGRRGQRFVHVGQQRARSNAVRVPKSDHGLGQATRHVDVGEERARAQKAHRVIIQARCPKSPTA